MLVCLFYRFIFIRFYVFKYTPQSILDLFVLASKVNMCVGLDTYVWEKWLRGLNCSRLTGRMYAEPEEEEKVNSRGG